MATADQYATFFLHNIAADATSIFGYNVLQYWSQNITFDHIYRHFRSMRNFLLFFFHKMAAGCHFGFPKITFDRISRHFRSIWNFLFSKWPQLTCTNFYSIFVQNGGHQPFGFPIFAQIDRVLPLWVINGCIKYEFDMEIGVRVMRNTNSRRRLRSTGDSGRTENRTSPKL